MTEGQLPQQLEDKLNQFRALQQQLQMISLQKQQLIHQSKENENALKEIEKTQEKIYRAVGPLLIETNKKESQKKLTEEKETLETRIKILEKNEKELTEKLNTLRREVETLLQNLQGGVGGSLSTGG